jgi:hypothetical protein
MGFESRADFFNEARRLVAALKTNTPLSPRDWTRALVATELAFASDVIGSGVEWATTTGLGDEETIHLLRELQRKLPRATRELG